LDILGDLFSYQDFNITNRAFLKIFGADAYNLLLADFQKSEEDLLLNLTELNRPLEIISDRLDQLFLKKYKEKSIANPLYEHPHGFFKSSSTSN
jgi:hypothetical protein